MDVQNSMRWGETLHREKMAKLKWQAKYLTPEEQQREADEEAAAIAELSSTMSKPHTGRSERDMMEMRLVGLDEELAALNIEPPVALHLQRPEHRRLVRPHRPGPGPRADPRVR